MAGVGVWMQPAPPPTLLGPAADAACRLLPLSPANAAAMLRPPPPTPGVSHLLEYMAFKTTKNRTHVRLVREVEAIGGNVLASGACRRDEAVVGRAACAWSGWQLAGGVAADQQQGRCSTGQQAGSSRVTAGRCSMAAGNRCVAMPAHLPRRLRCVSLQRRASRWRTTLTAPRPACPRRLSCWRTLCSTPSSSRGRWRSRWGGVE